MTKVALIRYLPRPAQPELRGNQASLLFVCSIVAVPVSCGTVKEPSGDSATALATTTMGSSTNDGVTAPESSTADEAPTSTANHGTVTVTDTTTSSSTSMGGSDLGGPTECDAFANDCPRGQKCVPYGEGAFDRTKCVGVTGDSLPGEPCTKSEDDTDDCVAGSLCWDLNANKQGVCSLMCAGVFAEPKCPPASQCAIPSDGIFGLCVPFCDPLLQNCSGGALCIPFNQGWNCAPDSSGDGGQVNDSCGFPNVCDKGLLCVNIADASSACAMVQEFGCCQPLCKFPEGACPNPDQSCLQWYGQGDEIPPGYDDVGICGIPK